uniref:Prospero domain-containing protein n=1 Tax=Timema poppense TaxID=170557 RepID=A0A7R9CTS1_TIMPO|nr:unnamed protein product [Timema poppensis]
MSIAFLTVHHSSTLTPMHLRKAKLMFFWVRYPSSAVLKMYFPDIKFNKNNTAQLVKWFSNFSVSVRIVRTGIKTQINKISINMKIARMRSKTKIVQIVGNINIAWEGGSMKTFWVNSTAHKFQSTCSFLANPDEGCRHVSSVRADSITSRRAHHQYSCSLRGNYATSQHSTTAHCRNILGTKGRGEWRLEKARRLNIPGWFGMANSQTAGYSLSSTFTNSQKPAPVVHEV